MRVGGRRGWPIILGGLKSLQETGCPMPRLELPSMPMECLAVPASG